MQKRSVVPGTFLSNYFFAENEIQIGELREDRQGIFVSFMSSVRCLLDASVYPTNRVWRGYKTELMHVS